MLAILISHRINVAILISHRINVAILISHRINVGDTDITQNQCTFDKYHVA